MGLIFEWDENKARLNFNKHKVSFEEAKTVFYDPFLVTFPDLGHSNYEQRYINITTCANCFCSPRFYLGFHNCQLRKLGYKAPSILDLRELAQVVKYWYFIKKTNFDRYSYRS